MNKVDEVKGMLNKSLFDILFLAERKIDSTVSSTLHFARTVLGGLNWNQLI